MILHELKYYYILINAQLNTFDRTNEQFFLLQSSCLIERERELKIKRMTEGDTEQQQQQKTELSRSTTS